eukprot:GSMAST32.ASY1.ANO1.1631.1 assembled CDS
MRVPLSDSVNPLKKSHVLSSNQFDRQSIETVMKVAAHMHEVRQTQSQVDYCKGCILGNLFFEPSTRTSSSFAAAMMRLGGQVLQLDSTASSTQKGESYSDTIRIMEEYTNIIAMRHPLVGSVASASLLANNPVINAGDGAGEHPTQSLLDIFTIIQELGIESPDNITVTMVGDLKNGRTVHSLSRLLSRFDGVKINFVARMMPKKYIQELKNAGVQVSESEDYRDIIGSTDEYENCKGLYVLNTEDMKLAASNMIVLHPLPRVDEIDVAVDDDHVSAYFRQAGCGLSLRMALLAMCLDKVDNIL